MHAWAQHAPVPKPGTERSSSLYTLLLSRLGDNDKATLQPWPPIPKPEVHWGLQKPGTCVFPPRLRGVGAEQ